MLVQVALHRLDVDFVVVALQHAVEQLDHLLDRAVVLRAEVLHVALLVYALVEAHLVYEALAYLDHLVLEDEPLVDDVRALHHLNQEVEDGLHQPVVLNEIVLEVLLEPDGRQRDEVDTAAVALAAAVAVLQLDELALGGQLQEAVYVAQQLVVRVEPLLLEGQLVDVVVVEYLLLEEPLPPVAPYLLVERLLRDLVLQLGRAADLGEELVDQLGDGPDEGVLVVAVELGGQQVLHVAVAADERAVDEPEKPGQHRVVALVVDVLDEGLDRARAGHVVLHEDEGAGGVGGGEHLAVPLVDRHGDLRRKALQVLDQHFDAEELALARKATLLRAQQPVEERQVLGLVVVVLAREQLAVDGLEVRVEVFRQLFAQVRHARAVDVSGEVVEQLVYVGEALDVGDSLVPAARVVLQLVATCVRAQRIRHVLLHHARHARRRPGQVFPEQLVEQRELIGDARFGQVVLAQRLDDVAPKRVRQLGVDALVEGLELALHLKQYQREEGEHLADEADVTGARAAVERAREVRPLLLLRALQQRQSLDRVADLRVELVVQVEDDLADDGEDLELVDEEVAADEEVEDCDLDRDVAVALQHGHDAPC